MRNKRFFMGIFSILLIFGLCMTGCDDPVNPTTYTITFNPNGGTGSISPRTVEEGFGIYLPDGTGFSRSGYTFVEWNTTANGTGSAYSAGDYFERDSNVTLYAQWEAIPVDGTYTITFNPNGGTGSISPMTLEVGNAATLPDGTGFSRSGYTFDGWNTAASGTGSAYNAGAIFLSSSNVTLYAQWKANPINPSNPETITFTYDSRYGWQAIYNPASLFNGNRIMEGDEYTLSYSLTSTAYLDYLRVILIDNSEISLNNYRWDELSGYNTVIGNNISANSVISGEILIEATGTAANTTPEANSLVFQTGLGTTSEPALTFTTLAITKKTSTPDPTTSYYTISFDNNGGSGSISPLEVIAGYTATLPDGTGFSRSEYVFSGWNTQADGLGYSYNANSSYIPTSDTTLYARWTRELYNITFYGNGGSGSIQYGSETLTLPTGINIETGASITLPAGNNVSRDGYIFTGWNTSVSGLGDHYDAGETITPSGNIVLNAEWRAIASYTLTLDWNDGIGTIHTYTMVEDALYSLDPASRTGYTFVSWNTQADGSGTSYQVDEYYNLTSDITLYAQWKLASIIVSFTADSAPEITVPNLSLYEGATVTLTVENPSRYDSINWYIPGTSVTGSGNTFTLDPANNAAYDTVGAHVLTVEVVLHGVPYSRTIIFTVSE